MTPEPCVEGRKQGSAVGAHEALLSVFLTKIDLTYLFRSHLFPTFMAHLLLPSTAARIILTDWNVRESNGGGGEGRSS